MVKVISSCPACGENLKIKKLQCDACGMELTNDFEISIFDRLNAEQVAFLLTFLKHRGNLKLLQEEMNISYPYAKKKLSDLLTALNLTQDDESTDTEEENEMLHWFRKQTSRRASDIIKGKLAESGGRAMVSSVSGKQYEIRAGADGQHFWCSELPPVYTYDVYDVIVDLLKTQPHCRAKKGNARFFKLGEPGCEENTVAGAILKNYFHKKEGESGLDPVFVLASVLEWAGIVCNGRGYLELTAAYRERQ